MKIGPACKEDDYQQNPDDAFILTVKCLGYGSNEFFRDSSFETWGHGQDQKSQPTNPNYGRQEMQPMYQYGNYLIEVGKDPGKGFH